MCVCVSLLVFIDGNWNNWKYYSLVLQRELYGLMNGGCSQLCFMAEVSNKLLHNRGPNSAQCGLWFC